MSCRSLLSVTINKIIYVAWRDKFVTEMIANVDCQHKDIFVLIFFTFRLPNLLTNTFLKDENAKFRCDKYVRTLIIDCD